MGLNVLVAEPENEAWISIADGIRVHSPDASILRVKDGEQAIRFLFHRGLFTDEPETPDLVVLATNLPIVSTEAVVTRMREHPRTQKTPVVVAWGEHSHDDPDEALEAQDTLDHQQPILIIGRQGLNRAVADAVQRLCRTSQSLDDCQARTVDSSSS